MGCVRRDSFTNSTNPICAESYPSFAEVFGCVTTHGPACSTVAGRTSPFESNSCVMPTFLPRIPATFAISFSVFYQLGFELLAGSVLANGHRPKTDDYLCSFPNA